MKSMDNKKVIEALEKYAIHKYLENLIHAETRKVTLFRVFAHTAAPNLSDPRHFVLVDDLSKIVGLNSGSFNN